MNRVIRFFAASKLGIGARSLLRKSGAGRTALIAVFKGFNRSYEEHFHQAIVPSLQPGDVVWDIGANVGLYTKIFLDGVGPSGKVVAVEPAPGSAAVCREMIAGSNGRLTVIEAALSDQAGTANFSVNGETSVTNRLTNDASTGTHSVRLLTADTLLAEGATLPTLIKVDVEGFEVNVLRGMKSVLATPQLRKLFIEVHFSLLEANGIKDGPQQIQAALSPHGFKLDWVDFSHVVASR